MSCLGNLLWLIFGGFISGLTWVLVGALWCITIIGIPIGMQCFKFASLAFFPFGKEVLSSNYYIFTMCYNLFTLLYCYVSF